MHSFIRFNGVEASIDNVIPASEEFNEVVVKELQKVYGDKLFAIDPLLNFTNPGQTDTIFSGIMTGQFESEAPVKIQVADETGVIATSTAFIGFRK